MKNEEHISVKVEKSAKTQLKNPEYLLQYDKIVMKNGDVWLVTKADKNQTELMLASRRILKKENIQDLLKGLEYIERSDCFEKS